MAWSPVSDYTPSGTVAAGAAGSTLQGGWRDLYGQTWTVSGGQLYTASTDPAWQQGILARPAAEVGANNRLDVTFVAGKGVPYAFLRFNGQIGNKSQGYALGVSNGNTLQIFTVLGGGLSSIGSKALASALVAGNTYTIRASIIQNANNTSDLAITLLDSTGAQIDTYPLAGDATSALQNVTGLPALFAYLNGATNPGLTYFTRLTSYKQASAATAYTLTGPSSGAVGTGYTLAVQPDGNVAADTTVTFSDGSDGTFSPATVTFPAGTSAAVTTVYTPKSAGSKSLSTTNNGSLTDPSPLAFNAAVLNILAVDGASWRFSPCNWKGDTGRGGSAFRQTWNSGAYSEATWTAGATSPTAILLIPSTSTGMTISYVLNGVLYDNVAATGNLDLSSKIIAGAVNNLSLFTRNNPQSAQWNNGTNTLQIQGLQIDSGSTGGVILPVAAYDVMITDSLGIGIQAADGSDSFLRCWTFAFGQAIRDQGRDFCLNGCGYSGYLRPGNSGGDVPAYYATPNGTYSDAASRWNKVDANVSILDSNGQISAYGATGTTPTNIWIALGTNEALSNSSTSDLTASVTQCLTALRGAAPTTTLIVIVPFTLYATAVFSNGPSYIAAIKAGFSAYQSANPNDLNVMLIDFGAAFAATLTSALCGGAIVHGNSVMHTMEAARMIPKLDVAKTRSHMALLKSSTGIVHRLRFNADGAFAIDPASGVINRAGTLAQGQAYPILAEQFDTGAGRYTGFLDTITAGAAQ